MKGQDTDVIEMLIGACATFVDTRPLGWNRSHNPALPSAASPQVAVRGPQDAVRQDLAPGPGEWALLS